MAKSLVYVNVSYQCEEYEIVDINSNESIFSIDQHFKSVYNDYLEIVNNGYDEEKFDYVAIAQHIGTQYDCIVAGFTLNGFEYNYYFDDSINYVRDGDTYFVDIIDGFADCMLSGGDCNELLFNNDESVCGDSLDGNLFTIPDGTNVWIKGLGDELFKVIRSYLSTLDGYNNYTIFYDVIDTRNKKSSIHQSFVLDEKPSEKEEEKNG